MTPPTARNRPGTTHSAARPTGFAGPGVRQFVGADRLAQPPGDRVVPVGVAHVVEGWQPLCGEPRVRFVFPSFALDDAAEVCDACASGGARRVPRQRRASTG